MAALAVLIMIMMFIVAGAILVGFKLALFVAMIFGMLILASMANKNG